MLDGDQNAEECPTTAVAADSSLPPRKRLLAGLKHEAPSPPPDSASSVGPDLSSARDPNPSRSRTRYLPNLSECHGCRRSGTLNAGPGGGRKLQMLKSGWRVVLLCRSCVSAINSGESQRRALSDACSEKGSKSSLFRHTYLPVKEVAREANSETEMAVAVGTFAKGKALRKTENATEVAALKVVLALAAVEDNPLRKGGTQVVGHCSGIDDANKEVDRGITDEELALQLHRTMNSSPRILKNNYVNRDLSSLREGRMCTYRKRDSNSMSNSKRRRNINGLLDKRTVWPKNDSGDSSKSESGSHSICGRFEACTVDKLFENPDRSQAELSVCLGASTGIPSTHDDTTKVYEIDHGTWKMDAGCDAGKEMALERFTENGVDNFEGDRLSSRDTKLDVQVKEEQASCSNKLANSSGDDDSLDTEFESCQNQNIALSIGDDESVHCGDESFNYGNKIYRTTDESCSCLAQNRKEPSSNESPRKYRRRCLDVKGIPHRKTDPLSDDLMIENQA